MPDSTPHAKSTCKWGQPEGIEMLYELNLIFREICLGYISKEMLGLHLNTSSDGALTPLRGISRPPFSGLSLSYQALGTCCLPGDPVHETTPPLCRCT